MVRSSFIELPDGRDLLVDAGPKSASGDAGERFIGPFLARQGIGLLSDNAADYFRYQGNAAAVRVGARVGPDPDGASRPAAFRKAG